MCEWSCTTPDGRSAAKRGVLGKWQDPVATTSFAADQRRAPAVTWNRRPSWLTGVTVALRRTSRWNR